MNIYLAGFIQGSKIKECAEWRIKIREHYNNWKGNKYPINWLDPLNSGEMDTISDDGLTSILPTNMIVHKDYMAVKRADLIVVNMDTFGEDRPLTGTICELAWAYQMFTPIIMITQDRKYIYHPFLKTFSSVIVPDVDTLLKQKWINKFFKTINSAQYELITKSTE